jgi:hypothetical protein
MRNLFSNKAMNISMALLLSGISICATAQKAEPVKMVTAKSMDKIDVMIGGKLFTTLLFNDSMYKPVLYPIYSSTGTMVTRGYPMYPKADEPTDHPHHMGLWFNYENVNGLDFWNNSFAIPAERKAQYGWIKTDAITENKDGNTGVLAYSARWTNQKNETLVTEKTRYEFSGTAHQRIIDRTTTLTGVMDDVAFNDAKDGMLGLRMAHELQIPTMKDQKFKDDKGIETVVKASTDKIAVGNYITSEGKEGDSAWSTRAVWCKAYGKMGADSVSISIIDHPSNPNYPTFWHARGYGLFAANPLGEKVFTNGKSAKNLHLKKGESVTFKYRIIIQDDKKTFTPKELDNIAKEFAKK